MKREIILQAHNLVKQYGKGSGATLALNDVSLKIYKGELLVILGSSGSGKSTLLNMIGGMDKPDSGSIMVWGTDICGFGDDDLTQYRKECVGFVFQSFNLIPELTARENIDLVADDSAQSIQTDELLSILGILEKADSYPSHMSGGEQQRVSIARALAKQSDFLLCDEPTGALDFETGMQVLVCLEELARKYGKTVVIVTHTREIAQMADRVIRIRNGRIEDEAINPNPLPASGITW